jgi:SAM-dependent methyltransferase
MTVHDIAARGFGDGADAYEQSRPSYSPDAVAWLVSNLRIEAGARVCDLAAGTGKFTRLLIDTGAELIAMEPVAGMRAVLKRELPSVLALAAVAEALAVHNGAFDAVVVAQAFHWFDPAAALTELHRVLRPGGRLGLVWNSWDDSVRWVKQIHHVVAGAGATSQWKRGHWSRDWVVDAIGKQGGFAAVERARFAYSQPLSVQGVVERVATTSHIASAPPVEREGVLDAVRTIVAADPEARGRENLDFPYLVDAFWCERS